LSIEDVRNHLADIRDEAGYTVPAGPADEMAELFATLMASVPEPEPASAQAPDREQALP
jgi:hypothetical protein